MNNDFQDFFGKPESTLKSLFDEVEYPWQMLEKLPAFLESLPLGTLQGALDPKASVNDPSKLYLGKNSEIGPNVLIEGAVYIGNNVKIKHAAYLRGPLFIEDGCVIGHASEIKHSIFFAGATAAHFNYVGNSVLGKEVQLGAGATCANLRFDKKNIIIRTFSHRLQTEHRKMGAFIGQGAQVGCQAVLSPGCIIAQEAQVPPLTAVKGFFERIK